MNSVKSNASNFSLDEKREDFKFNGKKEQISLQNVAINE
jgi:hypothetical protein